VTHAFHFNEDVTFLVIESRSSFYREPDRGMVGRNAFYDPASFGKPDLDKMHSFMSETHTDIREIFVKRWEQFTKFSYAENVFDTVGWKGDFFPFTLHVNDLMPMMSARVHLPPSAHTTFVADGFVVCTFLPRPLEQDADALKVPFYHQNIDYDEVLFYHDGNFFSRDNLHAGMLTLHPAGFPHGPHPKAVKNIGNKTHTDEYAVMIDSWQTLQVDPQLEKVEVKEYWQSWSK
jgi:homogentisate 1,2-dioxygenase